MALTPLEYQALANNKPNLLGCLEPDDIVDYLYSYEVINQEQFERIKSLGSRRKKSEALVSLLQQGRSDHYALFIRVLQKTKQVHLAQLLIPSASVYAPVLSPTNVTQVLTTDPGNGANASGSDRAPEPTAECLDFDRSNGILNMAVALCTDNSILSLAARCGSVYQMTQPVRGRALVVCNASFTQASALVPRLSADNDAANVASLLRQFDFDVELLRNITRDELRQAIDAEQQHRAHASLGAFILYLSSHGEDGFVFGVDGHRLPLAYVYDAFDAHNCPLLMGKPKLLIIEASQGQRLDHVAAVPAQAPVRYPAIPIQFKEFSLVAAAAGSAADRWQHNQGGFHISASSRLPAKADFIIAVSTFAGYASLRHKELGCWFSRALVEAFSKHAHSEHVAQLLRRVRRMVLQAETDLGYMQVSMTHDSLLKNFYLFPGVRKLAIKC